MQRERLCLWCPHFLLDTGRPPWSDVTPGDEADIRCLKGHWRLDHRDGAQTFRLHIQKAKTCDDYELEKGLELDPATGQPTGIPSAGSVGTPTVKQQGRKP